MGTNKKRKKLLWILGILLLLYLLYIISFLWGGKNLKAELHLIPNNYRGDIYIIFNQNDGLEREYQDKRRIYRIPPSGVLKTKFSPNTGWIKNDNVIKHYYVDYSFKPKRLIKYLYMTNINNIENADSLVATSIQYHNPSFDSVALNVGKYTIDTLKNINFEMNSTINIELLRKALNN